MSDRILIVDDKAANRRLLRLRLEAEFFLVEEATSGPDALEKLDRLGSFSAIITDLALNQGEAVPFCEAVRRDEKAQFTPIIMVTASLETSFRLTAIKAGADDLIVRPINFPLLFSRLRGLIRKKTNKDQLLLRYGDNLLAGDIEASADSVILLVEDDEILRESWHDSFERAGFDTSALPEPSANSERADEIKAFDLLVVNQGQAAHSGLRFAVELRAKLGNDVGPILLVLDEPDDVLMDRAFRQGVDDCVVKPIDPNELVYRGISLLRQLNFERQLKARHHQSLERSVKDSLTGLYNRHYLDEILPRQLRTLREQRQAACVLIVDLDGLKRINDEQGHGQGDLFITKAAELIKLSVRAADLCFRIGGG